MWPAKKALTLPSADAKVLLDMVADFHTLSEIVKTELKPFDHQCLNDYMARPTVENLLKILWSNLRGHNSATTRLYSLTLQEGEGGYAKITEEKRIPNTQV